MDKIEVKGREYPVEISFEDKRTSSATIKDGTVILRIADWLDEKTRLKHIESLLRRLKNVLEKGGNIGPSKKFMEIKDEHQISTFSKNYTVRLLSTPKKYSFGNIVNDMIIISLSEDLSEKRKQKSAYSLTRKLISKDHLIDIKWMIEDINRQHFNSKVNEVRIKEQTRSWGTCSHKNNINISFNALFLPKELLRYILVHELAHTMEHNHSKDFWKLVEKAAPNYRELRKEVKKNGLSYLPK